MKRRRSGFGAKREREEEGEERGGGEGRRGAGEKRRGRRGLGLMGKQKKKRGGGTKRRGQEGDGGVAINSQGSTPGGLLLGGGAWRCPWGFIGFNLLVSQCGRSPTWR